MSRQREKAQISVTTREWSKQGLLGVKWRTKLPEQRWCQQVAKRHCCCSYLDSLLVTKAAHPLETQEKQLFKQMPKINICSRSNDKAIQQSWDIMTLFHHVQKREKSKKVGVGSGWIGGSKIFQQYYFNTGASCSSFISYWHLKLVSFCQRQQCGYWPPR